MRLDMFSVTRLLPPAIASLIAFSLWKGLQFAWRHAHRSPLRRLRGPKGTSFFLGNTSELINDENGSLMEKWSKEYGETWRFKGFFDADYLFTMDTSAINHILNHSNDYQKPSYTRLTLAAIFGEGLFVAEGTQHRQQRRAMNPAFGPAQIRVLTETFISKAAQLRDSWASEIAKDPTASITGTRIDAVSWMNRVTLDIIGLTGFNYNFNSLDSSGQPNELREAFSTIFQANQSLNVLEIILRALIPLLRFIPTAESRKLQTAKDTMTQIGKELLAKAKATALASETRKGDIEKNNLRGRDLLSVLVKANMATDVPENQRLCDKDVIAQVPTFLFAGHETTSTAATWALFAMTQVPEVQKKLRDELLSVDTDTPSMDELTALPYLDAVVRETLRMYPPIAVTARVAMKDDVLPVEKSYVDAHGVVCDTIAIAKGDNLVVPILRMNRSTALWGADADEFKPDRWNDIPSDVSRVPGIWGHLLTFIGGPRACIGYRYALVELKAILYCLVRTFEFELAVPASDVRGKATITYHPVLGSDPARQPQLPLLIKPYQRP